MAGKLRSTGLALCAVMVAGAMAAPAARAVPEFTIGAAPATIQGLNPAGQTVTFTFRDKMGAKFFVICSTADFEGKTQNKMQPEIDLTPEYFECKNGANTVQPKIYGCQYLWRLTAALTAQMNITGCTTGHTIELVLSAACTVTIFQQSGIPHVVFQNVGTPNHLTANLTFSGIAYEQDGLLCPAGNNVIKTDGELTGTTTLKAYQIAEEKKVQNPTTGHQFFEFVTGTQVELKSQ